MTRFPKTVRHGIVDISWQFDGNLLMNRSVQTKSQSIRRKNILFLLLVSMSLATTGLVAQTLTGRWPVQAQIEHNPQGAPNINLTAMIHYAIWSWSERSGLNIKYIGMTRTDGFSTSGRITIIWRDSAWFSTQDRSPVQPGFTTSWRYSQTGYLAGAVITLNSSNFTGTDCNMMALVHEIGHGLGINGHSDDPHDVMYQYSHCRYALSANDAQIIAAQESRACHAELTREGNIYIPMIAGFAAYLEHNGDHTWTLAQLVRSNGDCSTAEAGSGTNITLMDLRGEHSRYMAELEWIGADSWRLYWAE